MATLSTVSRKKLLLSIDLECFDFIGALRSATQYISRSTRAVTAQLAPEVLDYLDLSTLKLESGSLPPAKKFWSFVYENSTISPG